MIEHRAKRKEKSPPTHPSPSRGEGKGGSEKGIALLHPIRSPLSRRGWRGNEKGIALVMVLILAAIALAIMAGLIYMITAGTQISGMQKRYKTALDAGFGGTDVSYQLISARGDPLIPGIPLTFNVTSSCLTDKLNKKTADWASACDKSITVSPPSSYDMYFDLGTIGYPTYRVYSKIVDTVEGNSGGDEGLLKSGVVSANSGEVTVMSIPYLYTLEIDAENVANPAERAKLSVLYQY